MAPGVRTTAEVPTRGPMSRNRIRGPSASAPNVLPKPALTLFAGPSALDVRETTVRVDKQPTGLRSRELAITGPTVESEWSPERVAELYERAEKALKQADALARRPIALRPPPEPARAVAQLSSTPVRRALELDEPPADVRVQGSRRPRVREDE
jgi:hypothetical protein